MADFGRGKIYEQNGSLHIEPVDDYEHIQNSVQYVMENILQTTNTETSSYLSLREKFNSTLLTKCDCSNDADEKNHLCVQMICCHGGNYTIQENIGESELVLNVDRKSQDVIYECSTNCSCPNYCCNRLVQFGPRRNLKYIDCSTIGKRFGLATTKFIPKGGFICEYAGEILSEDEAISRHHLNDQLNEMNYIICMNEHSLGANKVLDSKCIKTYIDASRISNIGRYLNHSCDPNCELISVRVDGVIPKICKIYCDLYLFPNIIEPNFLITGIFAKRDIMENEELCFSYGENQIISDDETSAAQLYTPINRKLCKCLSSKCRKYLPNF